MKLGPVDVSPLHQPDGRLSAEVAASYITDALRGERPTFEWVHRDAAGHDIPCEIRLVMFNRADTSQGVIKERRGWLGEVTGGRSKFRAELRGLLQKLQVAPGED